MRLMGVVGGAHTLVVSSSLALYYTWSLSVSTGDAVRSLCCEEGVLERMAFRGDGKKGSIHQPGQGLCHLASSEGE